jgi:hypothetical protein
VVLLLGPAVVGLVVLVVVMLGVVVPVVAVPMRRMGAGTRRAMETQRTAV